MVRKTYFGWGAGLDRAARARAEFRALLPLRRQVARMADPFFPFREDWSALTGINDAMDRAVRHFGLDPRHVWPVDRALPDPDNPVTRALEARDAAAAAAAERARRERS